MPLKPGVMGDLTAAKLDTYLAGKSSPMFGQGANFMQVGARYGLDPRLLIALAGAETGFGANVTRGANNAWNWLYNGRKSPFDTWLSGMTSVAKGLTKPTSIYDMTSAQTFYLLHYCHGPKCPTGLRDLEGFMREMGGDPNALGYPQPAKP